MLEIHRRDIRRKGRQIISFLLVTAMILGLVSQNAYASTASKAVAEVTEKTYETEGCMITYKETSTWGNYVNVDITIKNEGKNQQANWKLSLVFDGTIDNIWNADVLSAEDGQCTVAAKLYNSVIEPGQTVSFGFMAYGADGKPNVPKDIRLVKDAPLDNDKDDKEDNDSNGSLQRPSHNIPDKWKALNYALFTSGNQTLSLYTGQTNIIGSVHSNKDFYYQGTTLSVDGVL
ncbi:MAG: cellulose-binding domain-containing protein, partial [Lachnospiraceae bacterium]|nr:cellulose-binding domain-containing protein [Lachnospiraceae bacterium]